MNNPVPISTLDKSITHSSANSDRRISPFDTQYKWIEQWNQLSFTPILFIIVQYNDCIWLSTTIQFIHLIDFIQSLPIDRMIKNSTFLFWTLNQTWLTQFSSSISHKSLIFILNIDNIKDWIMLAKPVCVVIKWWQRVNGWLDPKSMTKEWRYGVWKKQSKHWITNDHWMKWNGMNCVNPMQEVLLV